MAINYSDAQIDLLLDLYFRNHIRPAPWKLIANAMGISSENGLDDLLWKVVTGYNGHDPDGPRRKYAPATLRTIRHGWYWYPREDDALIASLQGQGQRRDPPCDAEYISKVLMRSENEVLVHMDRICGDPLNRRGFDFGSS